MGKAAEQRLLDEHGTQLCTLKPANVVQAAEADLRLRRGKSEGWVDQRTPYAFHRAHVRKAESPRELITTALQERGAGMASGKRNTRMIYGAEALLQQAIEIVGGDAHA